MGLWRWFINRYRERLWFKTLVLGTILSILIGSIFYVLSHKDTQNSTTEIKKKIDQSSDKLLNNCLGIFANLTHSLEEYVCSKSPQENETCYSNVTVIKVLVDGKESYAILIDDCDFIYTKEAGNFKTGFGLIYMIVNPRWKDNRKHVLGSFSDTMILYVEDYLLKLKVVELDGTEHTLVSDVPKKWNKEEWYAIIAFLDLTKNQIKLYVDGNLVANSIIDNLNVQIENLSGFLGTDSKGKYQANAAFQWVAFTNVFFTDFPKQNPPRDEIFCDNITYIEGPVGKAILIDKCGRFYNEKINFDDKGGLIYLTISPRWRDNIKHVLASFSDKMVIYVEDSALKFKVVEIDGTEHILVNNASKKWNNESWYRILAGFDINSGKIGLNAENGSLIESYIINLSLQTKNLTLYIGVDSNGKYKANAAIESIYWE